MYLHLFGVIQTDPACAGFELAPFGRAGARALRDDGINAVVTDAAVRTVAGAGAFADVQGIGGNLYAVRAEAVRRCNRLAHDGQELDVDRTANGILAVHALVDDGAVAADLADDPLLGGYPVRDSLAVVVGRAGQDAHDVALLDGAGSGRGSGLRRSAQRRSDLHGEIAHAGVHPVAGAALVGKPAMDGQDHFVGLGGVIQGLVLVAQPKQLGFAIALADVHAELDEGLIDHILERIRFRAVAGALDGHGPLVVGIGGRTPAAVLLLNVHTDTTVKADAVVAAGLLGGRREDAAQRLHAALADHAVRRDAVDAVGTLPAVVRAELRVAHHR